MSYASLILVILAAMAHATWNLLAKRAAMVGPAFVFAYGLCAVLVYAPWVIWILLHAGMVWSWPVVLCILASGALHLGYSLRSEERRVGQVGVRTFRFRLVLVLYKTENNGIQQFMKF